MKRYMRLISLFLCISMCVLCVPSAFALNDDNGSAFKVG